MATDPDRWKKWARPAPQEPGASRWSRWAQESEPTAVADPEPEGPGFLSRARSALAGLLEPETTPEAQAVAESFRPAAEGLADFGRQAPRGMAEAGLATAEGVANIAGAGGAAGAIERTRDEVADFYGEPEGAGGTAGYISGRFLGEGAQFAVPGSVVGRAARALPAAAKTTRVGRAVERVANPKSFFGELARETAFGAPIDVAIASAGPEESTAAGFSALLQTEGGQRFAERFGLPADSAEALEAIAADPVKRAAFEATFGAVASGTLMSLARGAGALLSPKVPDAPPSPIGAAARVIDEVPEGAAAPSVEPEPRPSLRRRAADLIDPEGARELREARREIETDPLTGLGSRRALERAKTTVDEDPEWSWLALDADGLKGVNDTQGHEAGDEFLRRIGQTIAQHTERGFHPSGDEFVVAVPRGQEEQVGRAIQEAVGRSPIGETGLEAGISFGSGKTISEADEALRQIKEGRASEGLSYRTAGQPEPTPASPIAAAARAVEEPEPEPFVDLFGGAPDEPSGPARIESDEDAVALVEALEGRVESGDAEPWEVDQYQVAVRHLETPETYNADELLDDALPDEEPGPAPGRFVGVPAGSAVGTPRDWKSTTPQKIAKHRAPYEGLPDDELLTKYRSMVWGLGRIEGEAEFSNTWQARGRRTQQQNRVLAMEDVLAERGIDPVEARRDLTSNLRPSDLLEENRDLPGRIGEMDDAELESEIRAALKDHEGRRDHPVPHERLSLLHDEAQKPGRKIPDDAWHALVGAMARIGTGAGAGFAASQAGAEPGEALAAGGLVAGVPLRGRWFSRLTRAVEQAPFKAAPASQWAGYLRKAPGGIAKGEREWVGIDRFLEEAGDRKLTRYEVLGFARERGVRLGETVLKGRSSPAPGVEQFGPGPSRYESYTEPGGENYREILIRLEPSDPVEIPDSWRVEPADLGSSGSGFRVLDAEGELRAYGLTEDEAVREALSVTQADPGGMFRSGHFDEPNVLAHARVKDRTYRNPETGQDERVLFIEEIQSDWHQKGRSQGYAQPEPPRVRAAQQAFNEASDDLARAEARSAAGREADVAQARSEYAHAAATVRQVREEAGLPRMPTYMGVPDAPFKKTDEWVEMALKRVLAEAAEEGYDRVAWVTGKMSADRYDLRKQVDRVMYDERSGALLAQSPEGENVLVESGVRPEQISDYIGKEPARRLLDAEPGKQGVRAIQGEQLAVGGEGMTQFYDRILPKVAQKYTKGLGGGKVEPIRLGLAETFAGEKADWGPPTLDEDRALDNTNAPYRVVQSLPITPALRDQIVNEGQRIGAAPLGTVARIATGGAGAAAGAAMDDESPTRGAIIGLGVGIGLPSVAKLIPKNAAAATAFWKRHLTSAGDLPPQVMSRKVRRDGWMASHARAIAYTDTAYRKAVRQTFGSRGPSPEDVAQVDAALKGEVPLAEIPAPMRPVVLRMRNEMDQLARRMLETGAVQGDLRATVEANMGVYAHRSYRVFDDPDWAAKVPEDVKNRAINLLRSEYPEKSEAQIQGLIDELLFRGKRDRPASPIQALSQGSKLGSKDLSALRRRKSIHPAIRALWGEYTDARVNHARSVSKMAALIANHQFLEGVRRAGRGEVLMGSGVGRDAFLFDGPIVKDGVSYSARVAAEGSKVMEPLNGLYTSEPILRSLQEAVEKEPVPGWLRHYMKINGFVKAAKTVLSPQTQVRNVTGNIGFAVANGHWRAGATVKGAAEVLGNLRGKGSAYYQRLQRLGVVGESALAGELRDVVEDAVEGGLDRFSDSWVERAGARVLGAATEGYQAGDDLWKVFAFENEKARYSKALPELDEVEIEDMVASIVRDTYPTYSMVPRAVKLLRRFPLVGTFVSFPAEVLRTLGNTLELTSKELADPRLHGIGAQRLAGLLAVAGAVPAAAAASRHMVGVSRDDDRDVRRFLPPWSENSTLFYLSRAEDAFRYIDLSYTDPYSYVRKPAQALLRGEDFRPALVQATLELFEPFGSEEILAERVLDVTRNKRRMGGTVYNEADPWDQKAFDIIEHIGEALEPGGFTSAERITKAAAGTVEPSGRSYDLTDEVVALASGFRMQALDLPQALSFRSRDFNREADQAGQILTSVAYRRGNVSDNQLRAAYLSSERQRLETFRRMHEDMQAAIKLGLPRDAAERLLEGHGLSQTNIAHVLDGTYEPYVPTARWGAQVAESQTSTAKTNEEEDRILATFDHRREVVQDLAYWLETQLAESEGAGFDWRQILGKKAPAAAQEPTR